MEVDPDLGSVRVTDIVAMHDVGKVINLSAVEGQVEGGISMGLGYALYEGVALKSDLQWVDTFSQYLIPTTIDIPDHIEVVLLEVPEKTGPFGAKGIGEIVLVPTAPAVANAVFDAVSVRVNKIPISASDILKFDR